VATRELPQLDQLYRALLRRLPGSSRAGIVHGDYRLDNTILSPDDPGTVVAIVDWEMATLGDPLVDLGLLLAYWDPVVAPLLAEGHAISGNPGFPDAAEVAARYLEQAGLPPDADLSFYRALGYYKLAVIAEGIHHRFQQGLTVGRGFETVSAAVVPLLESGLVALGEPVRG
jgi:aminoglycoside phosphotransferase (APT) family kinase protein